MVVALFVALTRFLILRKRAPKRDRAADEMDKHRLYQEISEMQRNSLIGRPRNFEPPPVYAPPPPTYHAGTNSRSAAEDGYQGQAFTGRDDLTLVVGTRPSWERRSTDNPTIPLNPGQATV